MKPISLKNTFFFLLYYNTLIKKKILLIIKLRAFLGISFILIIFLFRLACLYNLIFLLDRIAYTIYFYFRFSLLGLIGKEIAKVLSICNYRKISLFYKKICIFYFKYLRFIIIIKLFISIINLVFVFSIYNTISISNKYYKLFLGSKVIIYKIRESPSLRVSSLPRI